MAGRDLQIMNRRSLLQSLAFVMACIVLGCAGENEKDTPSHVAQLFAGQSLDVVVPSGHGFAEAWQIVLDEWSAQTGAECRIYEADFGDETRSVAEVLSSAGGRSSDVLPTLFLVPNTRLAELGTAGLCANIPAKYQSGEYLAWKDIFRGLRAGTAMFDRKPICVPVSSPVLVCGYRADLLTEAGLSPPETWGEYQKLIEKLDDWAPGLTATEPWGEEFRSTLFFSRAAAHAKHPSNYSFFFDVATGAPTIDTPGFHRALEQSQAALAKMPAEVRDHSPADCLRELLTGRAAIGLTLDVGAGGGKLPFGPSTETSAEIQTVAESWERVDSIDLGFVRLPGAKEVYNMSTKRFESPDGWVQRATVTGFAGLSVCVAAEAKDADAAWNLLGTIAVTHLTEAFPVGTKSACRTSQIDSAADWLGPAFRTGESIQYSKAVAASLDDENLLAELPLPGRQRFRQAMTEALGQLFSESPPSPSELLKKVSDEWQAIRDEMGDRNVHTGYLRCLGVPVVE